MPGEEVAALVASSTPYLSAALAAYGTAVLSKARDEAADATVSVGRRLLQRVFGRRPGDGAAEEALPAALAGAAAAPSDADVLGALRLAIRRELEADPAMLADVREILGSGHGVLNAPRIRSGRDTYYAGRDMEVNRAADPAPWPTPAHGGPQLDEDENGEDCGDWEG